MPLTAKYSFQLEQARALIHRQQYLEAAKVLKPLLQQQIPEALLLNVDVMIGRKPSVGLDYVFELAEKDIPGAHYKAAFLLYFHPQVGVAFQPYLYAAYLKGDENAVVAAVNLYYQQGNLAKAQSILYHFQHLESVSAISNMLDFGTVDKAITTKDFDDIKMPDLSSLSYQLIAQEINLYTVDDFINDFECHWLRWHAEKNIKRSTVVDGVTGKNEISKARTGSVAQLTPSINDWILLNIEMKIAAYFNLAIENGELSNVLHYSPTEEYKAHYDFFHPKDSGSAVALRDGGQRFKTVLIYLNDVKSGGETCFPRLSKSIKPKCKQLLIFNNTDNNFAPLPLSLHQGMPVIEGEKWLFSKWIREKPTTYKNVLNAISLL
ncbi:2OG-Fe(II) oxygenase [Pseudomonadota bacterium]|uniref:2OG-Fe(II) oxygenase n=1 Tax=unclassified Shewanella TaxID=196818 RepID=UPI0026E120DA|nr:MULTISPECIES: 2OG-Fe(II) oxygenase [unclassified Shewanella]MDO6618462.1 2OG-Fe(II) oxygenase [Shewanella sp. 6_MG-2023]MDO6640279.1 2OG-Fe(II) oxygenase [Shewanella sp. 5_MG-2023]